MLILTGTRLVLVFCCWTSSVTTAKAFLAFLLVSQIGELRIHNRLGQVSSDVNSIIAAGKVVLCRRREIIDYHWVCNIRC